MPNEGLSTTSNILTPVFAGAPAVWSRMGVTMDELPALTRDARFWGQNRGQHPPDPPQTGQLYPRGDYIHPGSLVP